jgi:hypothetical protein
VGGRRGVVAIGVGVVGSRWRWGCLVAGVGVFVREGVGLRKLSCLL